MTVILPLKRLSVCPCGFNTLDDSITLGVRYRVRLDLVRTFNYTCGRCHLVQRVPVVRVNSVLYPDSPLRWFPFGLFEPLDNPTPPHKQKGHPG